MKRYRWIVTGLLCMIGIGLHAVTRTVDITGAGQYTSIQTAVSESSQGDTVLVYPGRYQENISIQNNGISLISLEAITGNPIYIDSNWELIKLDDLIDIFNGSTPKRDIEEYWNQGTIPWFTIDDIRVQGRIIKETRQFITEKALAETSLKLLPKNTVLLCCTASIGEYAFTEIELTTNQQFNGLVIKETSGSRILPKYLFWYSSLFKDELDRLSGKSTFCFVSVGTLKKITIHLPDLSVQQAIVERIENEQKLIDSNHQLITLYEKN